MNNEQIEPEENEYEQTIKVSVTFTGFVSVWKKNRYNDEDEYNEDMDEQLKNMTIDELANETDTFEIEEWREV